MTFQIAAGSFFVFMFAWVRAGAWLAFVPPFSSGTIPPVVRVGLSAALGLAATSQLTGTGAGSAATAAQLGAGISALSTAGFISGLVLQVATGAVLGFITSVLLSVISAGGGLTDVTSGLSAAQVFDPISGTNNPVTANTFNVIMTTLLFCTGGDLLIVKGFMTSFRAVGLSTKSVGLLGTTLVSEVGFFFLAAVEIAAPVLACMFLAYVALGLLTRSAPQLNVMALGFGINIALALVVVAACLPFLPGALTTLVDRAVTDTLGLLGIRT
jgi:flagellar biosynthetic protein FliR